MNKPIQTFKNGDFVRIKTLEQFHAEGYATSKNPRGNSVPFSFVREMEEYAGSVAEISRWIEGGTGKSHEDGCYGLKNMPWNWGYEMFDLSYSGPVSKTQAVKATSDNFDCIVVRPGSCRDTWREKAEELGVVNWVYGDIPAQDALVKIIKASGAQIVIENEIGQQFIVGEDALGPIEVKLAPVFTHVVVEPLEGWSTYPEMATRLGATKYESGRRAKRGSKIRIVKEGDGGYILIADEEGLEYLVTKHAFKPLEEVKEEKKVIPETPKKEPVKSQEKKEKEMNVRALEKIADKKLAAELELAGATGLDGDIVAALEEQMAKQKKDNAAAAATEILTLVKQHSSAIEDRVSTIRSYKKAIEEQKASMEKLNRAKAYGLATNNWIPLACELGLTYRHRLDDETLADIPKDFVLPKAEEAAPAAAPKAGKK